MILEFHLKEVPSVLIWILSFKCIFVAQKLLYYVLLDFFLSRAKICSKVQNIKNIITICCFAALFSHRQLAKTLAMGQGLALLICGTAISSQYLATDFQVNTPMLQSFLNYSLLCVTYTTMLLCRTGNPITQGLNT